MSRYSSITIHNLLWSVFGLKGLTNPHMLLGHGSRPTYGPYRVVTLHVDIHFVHTTIMSVLTSYPQPHTNINCYAYVSSQHVSLQIRLVYSNDIYCHNICEPCINWYTSMQNMELQSALFCYICTLKSKHPLANKWSFSEICLTTI